MEAALADKPIEQFNLATGLPTTVFTVNKIPDLVGLVNSDEILRLLAENDLELGSLEEVDAPQPAGTVVSQNPPAGGTVIPGSGVDIVVSTGFNTIPEGRGSPLQDAVTLMERAGYGVQLVPANDPNSPPNVVIAQSVPAQTIMPVGTVVTLTFNNLGQDPAPDPAQPQPAPAPNAAEPQPAPQPVDPGPTGVPAPIVPIE